MLSVKGEQIARIADYERKFRELEQEVEKYRILSGIESLAHGFGLDESSTQRPSQKPDVKSPTVSKYLG